MKRPRACSAYNLRKTRQKDVLPLNASNATICSSASSEESMELKNDDIFKVHTDSDDSDSDFDTIPSSKSFRTCQPAKQRRVQTSKSIKTKSEDLESPTIFLTGPPIDSPSSYTEEEVNKLQAHLLEWYRKNHRTFPWRRNPAHSESKHVCDSKKGDDRLQSLAGAPYAVWISEVMSQQTRIEVVVDYFTRWMREFPTIEALASADLDRVNEIWAGLGYYRRAKFLHEGARQVLEEHSGILPSDVSSLRKIKGIGAYTAGAISSIAFSKCEPAVDGNVERVLARIRPGILKDFATSTSAARNANLWKLAREVIHDVETPGDFNQAIMELGATVCKPKSADCGRCPLKTLCGAHAEALSTGSSDPGKFVAKYPIKDVKKRVKVRKESVFACVVNVFDGNERLFLVLKRPKNGLLAGLWESPNVVLETGSRAEHKKALESVLLRTVSHTITDAKIQNCSDIIESTRDAGEVAHVFSHIVQSISVKVVTLKSSWSANIQPCGEVNGVTFQWLSECELSGKAIPTQMKKVFRAAGKEWNLSL